MLEYKPIQISVGLEQHAALLNIVAEKQCSLSDVFREMVTDFLVKRK